MTDFDAESYLAQLTTRPGVYQMFDGSGELLYVGKAKNLKNRVTSYFRASGLSAKTMALVARIASIEVTVTTTERDALLLEHNICSAVSPPPVVLPLVRLYSGDLWLAASGHASSTFCIVVWSAGRTRPSSSRMTKSTLNGPPVLAVVVMAWAASTRILGSSRPGVSA